MTTNTSEQEVDTRHAALFASLLAQVNLRTGGLGHQWVEIINSKVIQLHTRYHTPEGVYKITQTVHVDASAILE